MTQFLQRTYIPDFAFFFPANDVPTDDIPNDDAPTSDVPTDDVPTDDVPTDDTGCANEKPSLNPSFNAPA